MKISGGLSEKGVMVGNTFDKYHSGNPIVRKIMHGFESTLLELVDDANPSSIHEVGCGEGYWVLRWAEQGKTVRGSDFSNTVIDLAKSNAFERKLSADLFKQQSIYDLQPEQDSADLIVCCEVLEHLEQPEEALHVMQKITQKICHFQRAAGTHMEHSKYGPWKILVRFWKYAGAYPALVTKRIH